MLRAAAKLLSGFIIKENTDSGIGIISHRLTEVLLNLIPHFYYME